jgi:hypothetical protein
MKTIIVTTRNSGENLKMLGYESVKDAGKHNRLSKAQLTLDTTSKTRVSLLKQGDIIESRTIYTGCRVYLFWDPELCDLEVYPDQL